MSHFMMGTQFIALASRVERWSWRPSDRYGGGQFGILVKLPNDVIDMDGQQVVLEQQSTWLNVDVNQNQLNKPAFNTVQGQLQGSQQTGGCFFLATGGRLKTSRAGKQSMRFSLPYFRIRSSLTAIINKVVLDVNCVEVSGRWMKVSERYRIPNPKQGQSAFGERMLWVYLPEPMQIYQGHPVYVEGRLAFRNPAGQENLYVIADLIA